jgi:HEAT repeat protein
MKRIRNLTLFVVGVGLLLSPILLSISVEAGIDGPSAPSGASRERADSYENARRLAESNRQSTAADRIAADASSISAWALWSLGLVELWVVGWPVVWAVSLAATPGVISSADAWMRKITVGRLPFSGGVPITLAHLTFVGAFAQHRRVLEHWLDRHAAEINDWLSIEAGTPNDTERELLIRSDKQTFTVADASTVRAILPESPFILAIHETDRRWNDRVLNVVLRQAMHADEASRMLPHRVIPVVLDRNCVERLKTSSRESRTGSSWLQVVRNELCRIPEVAQTLDDKLLNGLLQSRRILPIAEEWSRLPVDFRNDLQSAVSTGHLSCLVVFGEEDSVVEMKGVIRARSVTSGQAFSHESTEQAGIRESSGRTTREVSRVFDASAVPLLARSLGDSVADIRLAAALALGSLGFVASGAVQELSVLLSDPVTGCRQAAVEALGLIGPPADFAATQLAAIAVRDHRTVRAAACRSLGAIDRSGEDVMMALMSALQDVDPAVRSEAARSLGSFGAGSVESGFALTAALKDESAEVRHQVVTAMTEIPDTLNESLGELVTLIADSSVEVRRAAVTALGRTERARPAVVKTLAHSLSDPDAETRARAAASLGGFGHDSRQAVPQLTRTVLDSVADVRRNAVAALDAIGLPSVESVSALEEATRDADDMVRSQAQAALERIVQSRQAA